jgi:chromosome segregation ATPase
MGFPVKVSDELYQKIKERAEEQGSTLQDALVDLLTEPYEEVRELKEQLAQTRRELQRQNEDLAQIRQAIAGIREQVKKLGAENQELRGRREEDIKAINSWISRIQELEGGLDELWEWSDRVDKRLEVLDRYRHRHLFQEVG